MRTLFRPGRVSVLGVLIVFAPGAVSYGADSGKSLFEMVGGAAGTTNTAELMNRTIEDLMEIEISTVSRVSERIDEAPGTVYVFSRDTIRKRGYRSLGELLQTVPGFTVFHRDLQFVAGVRGLNANDNEKITLLINGQALNQVDEPDFLNGPINLDNVERVEVVVGPSSLFQRANTLAATINVITRDVNGTEVIGAAGNDLPGSGTLMTGKRWAPDQFVSLSVTSEKKRGFDAWDPNFRRRLAGTHLTGELDWPSYFGVLKGQYGELSGQAVSYRSTFPELYMVSDDSREHGDYVDQFSSALLSDRHPWTPALESIANLSATQKKSTRSYTGAASVGGTEIQNAQWTYEGDLGLRHTGLSDHHVQAGFQTAYEDNFDSYYVMGGQNITLVDSDSYAFGFYADDEYRAASWMKLIGGVRADHDTKLSGDRWFPGGRAAIVLEPTKTWVSKLIYNRAVRMPAPWASPLNIAWGQGKTNAPDWAQLAPNADKPEILSTYSFANIIYMEYARLGLTVYHQNLDDFITWYNPASNVGDFSGNGAELSIEAPVDPDLTVWANSSYNASKLVPFLSGSDLSPSGRGLIINSDGVIAGAPEYIANTGLDYQVVRNVALSPGLRYFTRQVAFDHGKNEFVMIRDRCYLDAAVTWRNVRSRNMDMCLSGRNILNNRNQVAGQWLGDTYKPRGATVVLSVDMRF